MKRKCYFAVIVFLVSFLFSGGCGKDNALEEKEDQTAEEKVNIDSISQSKIISILSSSTLKNEKNSYRVGNIFDKRPDGCWCEGKKGDGTGEYITLTFDKIVTINKFYIMNGFADTKLYRKKNRVRSMDINGVKVKLKDTPYVQVVNLEKPLTGEKITYRITGVYKGEEGGDACIAEISFGEIRINPVKSIVFPLKISRKGYTFTMMDEGRLKVSGVGNVDCPAIFVKGEWTNNSRGDYVIKYTVKSDKMCGNIKRIRTGKDWDFHRMNTVFTAAQLRRVIRF